MSQFAFWYALGALIMIAAIEWVDAFDDAFFDTPKPHLARATLYIAVVLWPLYILFAIVRKRNS